MNLILTVISTLVSIAILAGIVFAISAVVGLPIRIGFATPVHYRIERTFFELMRLLRNASDSAPDNKEIKRMLGDTERLYEQWNASRITRFVRWVTRSQSKKERK